MANDSTEVYVRQKTRRSFWSYSEVDKCNDTKNRRHHCVVNGHAVVDGNNKSQQQTRIDTISTRRREQTYKQTEGHHHRVMTPLALRAGGDLTWTTRTLVNRTLYFFVTVTLTTPLKTTVEQHGRTTAHTVYAISVAVDFDDHSSPFSSFVRNYVRLQFTTVACPRAPTDASSVRGNVIQRMSRQSQWAAMGERAVEAVHKQTLMT